MGNPIGDCNYNFDAQDPLHPLGIWKAAHAPSDEFYWRVTDGTGAFGPGGNLQFPKRRNANKQIYVFDCPASIEYTDKNTWF